MVTKEIYAQLSDAVYKDTDENPTLPSNWIGLGLETCTSLNLPEDKESGFQGQVYYNTETKELIVAFRGTEFELTDEGYKDAIENDVMGFGQGNLPDQFYAAKALVEKAKEAIATGSYNLNGTSISIDPSSTLSITGHSLGGGLAELVGALKENSSIHVETFNPVGAEQIVENSENANLFAGGDYSNIHNNVISKDSVSVIFDLIGSTTTYKPTEENRGIVDITFKQIGETALKFPIITQNITDGHTIKNFIGQSSFQEETSPITYQSLISIIRTLKGDDLTSEVLAPILTPMIQVIFGTTCAIQKTKKIFGASGTITGGAASITSEVTIYETVEQIDDICQILIDNDFTFVSKTISANNEISLIVDSSSNVNASIDSIINENEYIEAYLNGSEIIYDEAVSQDTISVYTENNDFSEITQLINNSTNLKIAIVNEDVAGNSAILGDTGNNIIEYKSGISTLMGGAGKDVYVVGDEGATIIDSDGCGTVLYNGKMLAGGIKEKGQSLYTDSSGNSYELDGSTLVINNTLTIENFDGGDMKNDRNFVVANG